MNCKSSKNVWGKNANKGIRFGNGGTTPNLGNDSWITLGSSQDPHVLVGGSRGDFLAIGPFGSKPAGATALSTFTYLEEKSKFYTFEVESSSSGSSCSSTTGSGSNSVLTFGMQSKNYWQESDLLIKADENTRKMSSDSSSRMFSNHGSNSCFDWDGMVEGVFKEEIGKMTEAVQWGTCLWNN